MPLYGYAGRIAVVDLSKQQVFYKSLPENVARMFLGGKGLLYYYGYKLIKPSVDPLNSDENVLLVAPGLFAGLAPASSKVGFLAKSPLTSILCDTYAGQVFAGKMKWAGFDLLVVKGRSPEPVYLHLEKKRVEIRTASHLWGAGTWEVFQSIRRELGSSVSVAAIGPAGENKVRYANIIVDGFRAAGRCGLGAVMGSKNLKAISVRGGIKPPIFDDATRRKLYVEIYNRIKNDDYIRSWARYGTNNAISLCSKLSMCPTKHWEKPWMSDEEAAKLSGENVLSREVERKKYLEYAGILWGWGCPVKCSKLVRVGKKGYEAIMVKPEYENLAMLGLAPYILDLDEVLYLEWLVNNLGIDSISFGETISWLMELYEKGVLRRDELIGLRTEPRFGNSEAVRELAKLIAWRRGFGAILAEGVKRAAEILSKGEELAVHVKGLESAAWDPRGRRGFAISYATADVGASHLRGWPNPHQPPTAGPAADMVRSIIEDRDWKAAQDSLGVCIFASYKIEEAIAMLKAITGWDYSKTELLKIGWRTEALARIHAALAGKVPEGDTIPAKWMKPITEGPLKGSKAVLNQDDLRKAIREFYKLRGYHEEYGIPLPETLEFLGIAWAIGDAKRALNEVAERVSPEA